MLTGIKDPELSDPSARNTEDINFFSHPNVLTRQETVRKLQFKQGLSVANERSKRNEKTTEHKKIQKEDFVQQLRNTNRQRMSDAFTTRQQSSSTRPEAEHHQHMAPIFKPDGHPNTSTDPAEQINRITNRVKYIALSNNSNDRRYASIDDALMDSDHAFQQLDQPNMDVDPISGQLNTNISPVTTNN